MSVNNNKNVGKTWTKQEDELLDKLYNIDKNNLIEISLIHQRAPGGIILRLVKNKIVVDKKEIRGYDEYLKVKSTHKKPSKINDDKIIVINDNEYLLNANIVYEIKKVNCLQRKS